MNCSAQHNPQKTPQATPADLAMCPATGVWSGQIAQLPSPYGPDSTEKELCTARHGVAWGAGKHGSGSLFCQTAVAQGLGAGQLRPDASPVAWTQHLTADTATRDALDVGAVFRGENARLTPPTDRLLRHAKASSQCRLRAYASQNSIKNTARLWGVSWGCIVHNKHVCNTKQTH